MRVIFSNIDMKINSDLLHTQHASKIKSQHKILKVKNRDNDKMTVRTRK